MHGRLAFTILSALSGINCSRILLSKRNPNWLLKKFFEERKLAIFHSSKQSDLVYQDEKYVCMPEIFLKSTRSNTLLDPISDRDGLPAKVVLVEF